MKEARITMQRINHTAAGEKGCVYWLKRLGLFGFLFFLIKGLLWLTVPGLLVFLGFNS
jgi:hypothetical protein